MILCTIFFYQPWIFWRLVTGIGSHEAKEVSIRMNMKLVINSPDFCVSPWSLGVGAGTYIVQARFEIIIIIIISIIIALSCRI